MSRTTLSVVLVATAGVLATLAAPVRAAESFDACRGFIPSLPAVIATQGVWCLDKDLTTLQESGTAILVNANNVTIDCNGFKLGGLAAGVDTLTVGIESIDRTNTTVRNCNVRGFAAGIAMQDSLGGDGGHVIEDNRIEASTIFGINAQGFGTVVRRNVIRDTGGSTQVVFSVGLATEGTVFVDDNLVVGTAPGDGGTVTYGILAAENEGGAIRRNHVTAIATTAGNPAVLVDGPRLWLEGNRIVGLGIVGSVGVGCAAASIRLSNNSVAGFGTGESGCSRPAIDTNDIP